MTLENVTKQIDLVTLIKLVTFATNVKYTGATKTLSDISNVTVT